MARGGVTGEIRKGAGSATLGSARSSGYCCEMADNVSRLYDVRVEDIVFIKDLTNGGERGAGLKVLSAAMKRTRAAGKTLLAVVEAQLQPTDTERLAAWYGKYMYEVTDGDVWSDWMSPTHVFSYPALRRRAS